MRMHISASVLDAVESECCSCKRGGRTQDWLQLYLLSGAISLTGGTVSPACVNARYAESQYHRRMAPVGFSAFPSRLSSLDHSSPMHMKPRLSFGLILPVRGI